MNKLITYAVKAFDLTDNSLYSDTDLNEKIKSNSYRHFYHPEFYRFKQNDNSDNKLQLKTMFMQVDNEYVRIFDNPSDESNKFKISNMQFLCKDMLLCTLDEFKHTTVKNVLIKKLESIIPSIDPNVAPKCKVM